jgi:hypothetical protein
MLTAVLGRGAAEEGRRQAAAVGHLGPGGRGARRRRFHLARENIIIPTRTARSEALVASGTGYGDRAERSARSGGGGGR